MVTTVFGQGGICPRHMGHLIYGNREPYRRFTMGKGCLFGIGIGIGLILVPFIIKFVIFLLALLGIGIASAI
jgi:hypothetical protein